MIGDGKWIAPEFWMLLTVVLGLFFVWVSGKYIGGLTDTVSKLKDEVIKLGVEVASLKSDIVDLKKESADIKRQLFFKRT